MSKELPSLTPKQVIKALEKIGFEFFRQKGSHKIYVSGILVDEIKRTGKRIDG